MLLDLELSHQVAEPPLHHGTTGYSFTKIHSCPAEYFVLRNSFEGTMVIILPCFNIATQSEMGKFSGISDAHCGKAATPDALIELNHGSS